MVAESAGVEHGQCSYGGGLGTDVKWLRFVLVAFFG